MFHEVDAEDAIRVVDEEPIDLVLTDIFIRESETTIKPRGGLSLLAHMSVNVKPSPESDRSYWGIASLNIEAHVHNFRGAKTLLKPVSDEKLLEAIAAELATE